MGVNQPAASRNQSAGGTVNAPEHRPTPTQAFRELAMAVAQRTSAAPESSVTISRNAKGVAQFEVTARGPEASDCLYAAQAIYNDLCRAYPYPVTNGGTE
jgi:hypothetical protein